MTATATAPQPDHTTAGPRDRILAFIARRGPDGLSTSQLATAAWGNRTGVGTPAQGTPVGYDLAQIFPGGRPYYRNLNQWLAQQSGKAPESGPVAYALIKVEDPLRWVGVECQPHPLNPKGDRGVWRATFRAGGADGQLVDGTEPLPWKEALECAKDFAGMGDWAVLMEVAG